MNRDSFTENLKEVGTSRYTFERFATRKISCDYFHNKEQDNVRILELYGAGGILGQLYKKEFPEAKFVKVDYQKEVNKEIINDPNVEFFLMDNNKFVDKYLEQIEPFDIVDFDAYGSPNYLIKKFFEKRNFKRDFIVNFTDGLGLYMKRNKNVKYEERFLMREDEVPDLRHPWRHHLELSDTFLHRIGEQYQFNVKQLELLQGKSLNFTFGSYLFYK